MLDRLLLIAEARGLAAAVVINKVDLAVPEELAALSERFRMAGYPVLHTSAKRRIGLDQLGETLSGTVSALAGPSGVGKSSLLNALVPDLDERTREISTATGKGRHTTTWTTLFQIGPETFVADTPGMRQLGLWGVDLERLDELFPEFRPYLGACRYDDCRHLDEPGCAVTAAVEAGTIHPDRYASYRQLVTGEASGAR
jgi:ribosome biogenesis GTPase